MSKSDVKKVKSKIKKGYQKKNMSEVQFRAWQAMRETVENGKIKKYGIPHLLFNLQCAIILIINMNTAL